MQTISQDIEVANAIQRQMVSDGHVTVDDHGDAFLTFNGRKKYERLLDRLTAEEKIILQVGMANDRGVLIHF